MHYYYISGTSSGIGRAMTLLLLEREDVQVIGMSRTCTIEHAKYTHLYVDLSDPAQVTHAIKSFENNYSIDDTLYLINNAGVIDPIKYVQAYNESDIQKMIHVNLISAIQLISAFLKIPKGTYRSRVILSVSSGAATKIIDGWSLYGAAKAGLDHFSKHVAKELMLLGETETQIFSVAPGVVDTPMQKKIRETNPDFFSTIEHFNELHITNQLVPPAIIAQKYLRILDEPRTFLDVIFSIKDLS